MGKYIADKEIIYLDQFALSRLVDFEPGSVWEKLSNLIQEGVEMGRIVVPYGRAIVLFITWLIFLRTILEF